MKKESPNLTTYQQLLVDESSHRTFKRNLLSLCFSLAVLALAAGFVALFTESIPKAFNGWLVMTSALYIAVNWVAVVIAGIFLGSLVLVRFTMKQLEESPPWEQDGEKLKYKSRTLITTFAKKCKILSSFKLNFFTVVDIIADWTLFAVLVTVNHPYMAMLHGVAVALQYLLISKVKKRLLESIAMLPDPLEENKKTDIDDLMNKLCNPDNGK